MNLKMKTQSTLDATCLHPETNIDRAEKSTNPTISDTNDVARSGAIKSALCGLVGCHRHNNP